jgi:hypothetical protein
LLFLAEARARGLVRGELRNALAAILTLASDAALDAAHAIGPTQSSEIFKAGYFSGKLFCDFYQVHGVASLKECYQMRLTLSST